MLEPFEPPTNPGSQLLDESLEDLYEHAPCGYFSTLPDGTFAKVNQTFLTWTGYEREELLGGKRFGELLPIAGRIYHETHYLPLLHMQGTVQEIAFDLVCRDGRRLPVLLNTIQLRDATGAPRIHRTTVFNATDRRQYERELQIARQKAEQALALRDHFLSLAAHELKTPLTTLLGNVELLQRRAARQQLLAERDQRSLDVIVAQTHRLRAMVLALFDISRIETGQLALERTAVDVGTLVERVVAETQTTHGAREIKVLGTTLPALISGDALRLDQVFQNLIDNALKYSARSAPISVMVEQDVASVRVTVQDQGIGIPQAALPQLFERFYRADNAAESAASGLGIGLYVVKEIVELHGGHVSVESSKGQGSRFTVALPREPAPA